MPKHEECFTNEVVDCWGTDQLTTVQMYCSGHKQQDNAEVALLAEHKRAVHE